MWKTRAKSYFKTCKEVGNCNASPPSYKAAANLLMPFKALYARYPTNGATMPMFNTLAPSAAVV